MKTKYNIDDIVLCNAFDVKAENYNRLQKCVVSMITITRKGTRYRVKTECGDNQIFGKMRL